MKTILFVDDEINILHGLRRILRGFRTEYDMVFANSADEALEVFANKPIDVMVTDLRMPEHDGVYLLEKVRNQYPYTVRIVLSGYADREISLRTVGLAHQFISKPVNADILIKAIQRASTLHTLITQPELQKLVLRLNSLPSLPDLYYKIVAELNAPETSTQKIGKIIAMDMGMTARVLQLVNSSFFGLSNRIVDPVQATTFLGLETVRDLALSLHVFSQFNEDLLADMGLAKLWDHSLTVAGFSKIILQDLNHNPKQRDVGFVLGLLHDLGKLVLAQNLPRLYKPVLMEAERNEKPLIQLELERFGATHSDVGAYLLGVWGLDEVVMAVTAFHHEPENYVGEFRYEVAAVHIANCFANHIDKTDATLGIHMDYLNALGITNQLSFWKEKCGKFTMEGLRYG
ncbi:MAG: two-component system response regulator [Anaerolineaceae bacterium]|nr:two-component system response regulator [Anaerolineaceae bacterium]